ncbi:MAG: ABC transporter ATP-binding protein [Eubacteriales bacterium]|nr:ABC transporter ATP-binding protein [Eubacteriales bacterium]
MIVRNKDLVKRYGELAALNHFDLEVEAGEILGLLGPNGSGKTTCINCNLSVLSYDHGEIEVFGQKMAPNRYDLKAKIGLVPQDLALFQELTVRENIDYFCGLYITNKAERKRAVEEAIRFVQLEKQAKVLTRKLSGGLKRRLNIACGIAHRPELIFLDEPTVAVDAQSRKFILDGIRELNRNGSTIIYTSHYLEEVEDLCTRIVIMDEGRSLASGSVEELQQQVSSSEKIHLQLENSISGLAARLKQIDGVIEVEESNKAYLIKYSSGDNNLPALLSFLEASGIVYREIYSERPSLNDVFLELTGKSLRE